MYQVFNTLTNTPEAVLSKTPYELAGPLAERRYEQKRDEQGNLLYLDNQNETTNATREIWVSETESAILPNIPLMIDAGALYEWREILPTPADIAAETQRSLVSAVQNHLDAAARQYGYDDIKSAVTYADEPAVPKFQIEGQRFRAWRSLVWASCYAMLDDVLDNKRTVPTVDELLAELPALEVE